MNKSEKARLLDKLETLHRAELLQVAEALQVFIQFKPARKEIIDKIRLVL